MYAFEVLQRLHKYNDANKLFEFLLYNQSMYLLSYRSKWFERVALNYESHLKNPIKSFETLSTGLKDLSYVRRAGRLALYQRLIKMSQTKKYLKMNDLKDDLKTSVVQFHFEFQEAPIVEITGTILHSEYIPGRKNIFIQNFENEDDCALSNCQESDTNDSELKTETVQLSQNHSKSDILIKNRYNISVEQVALTHYIKVLDFTHGKHCETLILRTLFGMLFWDIIFDKTVFNVFVDKFQSCPLDLQTDYFYLNRKESIDSRLELLENSPIEFICELYSNCWNEYMNTECSLVSWSLFEDLNEFLSLVRCFTSNQLASLCKFMAQNYRYCRSGGPDLIIWSTKLNKCKFVEVKGPGDRLSHKQIMWMDFFLKNSIDVEVCYVKGQNSKRLRD
jgi:fanconi-associated nuclease 1